MPKNQTETPTEKEIELSKQRVRKFFERLDASSLRRLMKFQTTQEKIEAILKFSDIVGIERKKLPLLFMNLKKKL